jgi:hypothetical protein
MHGQLLESRPLAGGVGVGVEFSARKDTRQTPNPG